MILRFEPATHREKRPGHYNQLNLRRCECYEGAVDSGTIRLLKLMNDASYETPPKQP